MNRKQFAIAILFATILLTAVIVPLSTQQGGGVYDPWLDYNGDGTIDINELQPLGQAYGTSGDPTRDVSVTNWPLDGEGNLKVRTEQYSRVVHVMDNYLGAWYGGGGYSPGLMPLYVGNYSRMFVYLRVTDVSPDQEGTTTVEVQYLRWMPRESGWFPYYFDEFVGTPKLTLRSGSTLYAYAEFEVKAPYVEIIVNLNATLYDGQGTFWLWVYLRNQ